MHAAPLLLFIAADLAVIWAGHFLPMPHPVLEAAVLLLGGAVLLLVRAHRAAESTARHGLGLEITEMQQEVEKAARRYKSLLEGAGNGIFIFNADSGELQEMNRRAAELFGCGKAEMAQFQGKRMFPKSEQGKVLSLVLRLKRRGRGDMEGLTLTRRDGSQFQVEVDARVIELRDERLVHCIVRDITLKLAAEKAIRQKNRELSMLNRILAGMGAGPECTEVVKETLQETMDLFGADGAVLHLWEGAEGHQPQVAVSHRVQPPLAEALGLGLLLDGDSEEAAVIYGGDLPEPAAQDGWGCLTVVPLRTQDAPVGVMHLLHHERHHYVREELLFLATLGRQLGNLLEKSRLFRELNWKSSELLRSHRLLEKTSHKLSVSEIKLKQNLALVEQANLDLNRLDRMKNQFLGMVSHEFNTPLTSIISGAEHLMQQGLSREDREVLKLVRQGGLRLNDLVSDLLKLVRLEAKGNELNRAPVHLKGLLELIQEQFQPLLKDRGQTITFVKLEQLPYFDGDRNYLERVFSELLINAIKFTPDGGQIEVTGRVVDPESLQSRRERLARFNREFVARAGERCFLEVEVRDNGIGIPPEELQGIFDPFYEVGDIRHHGSGPGKLQGKGAGLGLAIVKGMVEAHGGMVWAESGDGSSFFLMLPLEQESQQPALF